uniref:Uncharacterized protein n=1 Tax=Rheinheimera sp. BAL341 TaxID=1708203 RepID=A0A486XQ13_9GAMM
MLKRQCKNNVTCCIDGEMRTVQLLLKLGAKQKSFFAVAKRRYTHKLALNAADV